MHFTVRCSNLLRTVGNVQVMVQYIDVNIYVEYKKEIPGVQTGLIPPFRSLGNTSETKYVLIGIYFYPFLDFEVLKVATPFWSIYHTVVKLNLFKFRRA